MPAAIQVYARARVAEDRQSVALANGGHGLKLTPKSHADEGRVPKSHLCLSDNVNGGRSERVLGHADVVTDGWVIACAR
jgi:hypothetical protein